ncbi:acetyl esterase/lipase [Sphingomonas endophytica]|uniref:Acetyl esterase/lipase n=1 Tax=Sphingomonas endophytica TaxID=869719 RepID=A0A7X0JA94_9SPHN|nr:alpha/beta hydrolase [Sphingomonas endophytica]MBB6503529.1 acetyl esterase/lipase [Sphingomonas endophytica]
MAATFDAPTRRALLAALAAAPLVPDVAAAQAGDETLPLWPKAPPGAPATLPVRKVEQRSKTAGFNDRWLTGIAMPTLTVRRPAQPNGAAVMLIPGGGYGFLAFDNEGEEQARWLTARGVTCFILTYRLPGEGWRDRALVPLQDAQRGLRLIRAHAARYGVDAKRVAVIGFSAGGHLAGSLATRHAERTYAPVDASDRLSARPDLAGLIYPVVSLSEPFTHTGSRDNLLGTPSDESARRAASVERHVDAQTAPVFLVHASDDGTVPIANSLAMYQALLAAQRPAELHAFDKGGHGFGVRLPAGTPAAAWPTLFAAFAAQLGLLPAAATP